MKVLITGACGFIGAHVCEHILRNTDWEIVIFDKLGYASQGYDRLRDIEAFDDKRVKVFAVNLEREIEPGVRVEAGNIDYILNIASESHVDNSIKNPVPFVQNNVNLMLNMLEYARNLPTLKKFVQFSTDEVYSTAPEGVYYKEGDRHNPGNPYSASKSAQEALARAWANTYKLPIVITNTMNCGGERQHPEKFIPMCIRKIMNGEEITIHGKNGKAGTRFYIHCRNVAEALLFILKQNETLDNVDASKGVFNIVGEKEIDNLTLAKMIAKIVGKPLKYTIVDSDQSRPGHDMRYALDGRKLEKLGWKVPVELEKWLTKTIKWSLSEENKHWLGF